MLAPRLPALAILVAISAVTAQAAAVPNLQISLTSTGGGYDAVYLSISEIAARSTAGTVTPVAFSRVPRGGTEGSITVDLMALQSQPLMIASDQLLAGRYTGVRLTLAACVVKEGTQTKTVTLPATPIDIECPFELKSVGSSSTMHALPRQLLLDFDLGRSLVDHGGQLALEPIVQATADASPVDVAVYLEESDVPAVAVSPTGNTVAALDAANGKVYFLDPATGAVQATITVGQGASDMEFKPDGGALLVANTGTAFAPGNTVTVIATSDLTATTLAVGSGPARIEFHPAGSVAYVLNRGGLTADNTVSVVNVVNPKSPFVAATITVGTAPYAVAFSTDGARAAVTSPTDRTVAIIDSGAHVSLATVGGLASPNDVTFFPGERRAVVADCTPSHGAASVDTNTFTVTPFTGVPAALTAVQSSPAGDVVYGLTFGRGVLVMMARDGSWFHETILAFADDGTDVHPYAGDRPIELAATPAGPRLFVAGREGLLAMFDANLGTPLSHVEVGGEIRSLSYSAALGKLVVGLPNHALVVDPTALFFGMRDPDRDLVAVEPPTDETPVDVGTGVFSDLVVLVDDGLNSPYTSLASQAWECLNYDPSTGICDEVAPFHDKNGWSVWRPRTDNVVKGFYAKAPDIFDYVLVFYGSEWRERTDIEGWPIDIEERDAGASHLWVRNFTRGLGAPDGTKDGRLGNRAAELGFATTRLQSIAYMNDLGEYDADGSAGSRNRPGWAIIAHELGHRFGVFLDAPEGTILDAGKQHWSRDFDSEASVLGGIMGNNFLDLGVIPGEAPLHRFAVLGREGFFAPGDLYLLGRLPTSSFQSGSSFRIANALREDPITGEREHLGERTPYEVGDLIVGERVDVQASSLLSAWGERVPESSLSQDTFRLGVCIVVPKPIGGGPATIPQGDLDEVRALVADVKDFWQSQGAGKLITRTGVTLEEGAISVGTDMVAGVSLAGGKRLYVADDGVDAVLVIDSEEGSPTYGTVLQQIPLPASFGLGTVFAKPDELRVYVVDMDASVIRIVDVATAAYVGDINLPSPLGGEWYWGPRRVPVGRRGPATNQVFMTLQSGVAVIDLTTEHLARTIEPPTYAADIDLTIDGETLVIAREAYPTVYFTRGGASDVISRAFPVQDLIVSKSCSLAIDESAQKIYWTTGVTGKIQRASLDGTQVEDLVAGLDDPHGLALHVSAGRMYFSDPGTDRILRADLDGSGLTTVISGVGGCMSLAIDTVGAKLYWVDDDTNTVQRANLDGSNLQTLVTGLSEPLGIALDVPDNRMYFTDKALEKIFRARLDGTQLTDVSPENLHKPVGIALDSVGFRMYFTQDSDPAVEPKMIRRANMYGGLPNTVLEVGSDALSGLALRSNPNGWELAAHLLSSGEEASLAGDYLDIVCSQAEALPNHTVDHARRSTSPPILVQAPYQIGFSSYVAEFDLKVVPAAPVGERVEIIPRVVPDIDLPCTDWWDAAFSREGALSVILPSRLCDEAGRLSIDVIGSGSHARVAHWDVDDGHDAFTDPPSLIVTQDGERIFIVRPTKLHLLK